MKKQSLPQLTRDYGWDNLRFLLILFVVGAHLLENAPAIEWRWQVYQIIYSFHMPAFLFLFGYFAKYSQKRIVFAWTVPYFVFQTLYILFAANVLKHNAPLQYTTPYWILWYLPACIFYQLLIPIYDVSGGFRRLIVLLASVGLALAAGFDKTVGYTMSLSRFLVFQPWFLLGFYCRREERLKKVTLSPRFRAIIGAVCLFFIALSVVYLQKHNVPNTLLYGSYPYSSIGQTAGGRGVTMVIAFVWIVFLFAVLRPLLNRRLFLITMIGQNTLPVFLLHGFIVRAIPVYCPEILQSPWGVVGVTCLILLVLGNVIWKKVIYFVGFSWLEKLMKWNAAE